jgi:hypothetical protein
MNFVLTKYIYPLETKRLLSTRLNIFLDNPRSKEEIEVVARYIRYSEDINHSEYDHNFIIPTDGMDDYALTVNGIVHGFLEAYSGKDSYIRDFYQQNRDDDIFNLLAKMWVVARFDDEGQIAALKEEWNEMVKEGHQGFFLLEDEHPIIRNSNILLNYTHLLSVLVNGEDDYCGTSFVLHYDRDTIHTPRVDRWLNMQLVYFGFFVLAGDRRSDSKDWLFYPFVSDQLYATAQHLDNILDEASAEKTLYIASLLKTAAEDIDDERMKLVVLVSVLELLLTHSPDFNRFNVEDSISKQFRLKAGILVYLNDRSRDLDAIRRRLKTIYDQRSNIAHGNFKELDKYVKSLSKKEDAEEYFGDLIRDLYTYIKAILQEFIKDRNFVEFLKNN